MSGAVLLRRLARRELPADTTALATFLIGCLIVSDSPAGRVAARITETEAYLCDDAAAHSYRGKTARNASLFLKRGHAYVYFIYGNHYCLNVSGDRAGIGAGVLLRAGELVEGRDLARLRRGPVRDLDLLRGPGRLAAGLGVTRALDALDLTRPGPLWLAGPNEPRPAVGASVRIGITKERDRLLRFYALESEHVSGPKSLRSSAAAAT
jgi:DNA-3-methyladenine glycosylase